MKTLKSILTVLIFIFTVPMMAQEKGTVSLTFSTLTSNSLIQPQMEGAPTLDITRSRGIGLNYNRPINSWLAWETGLEYSLFDVRSVSAINPPLPRDTTYSSLSLVSVPVGLKVNFLKYIFVNGGLLVDFDTNSGGFVDNQTGIGAYIGVGVKYDFKFGVSVFVNPYGKLHSLVPFSSGNAHYRVTESGVRFGVAFRL